MRLCSAYDTEKTNVSPRRDCANQNTEPHSLNLNLVWFLFHPLGLWFQHRIKDFFHPDQYGRWRVRKPGLLYQSFNDLGSSDMLMGLSPHTVCSGRFMRLAVVLYRICASELWERCNELMLEICRPLWVFFFSFQALLLTFSGILFCCWISLHSWRNNVGHIGSVVWSNNQNGMLLFLWWLAELSAPLHVEYIMFKQMRNNNKDWSTVPKNKMIFFHLERL